MYSVQSVFNGAYARSLMLRYSAFWQMEYAENNVYVIIYTFNRSDVFVLH